MEMEVAFTRYMEHVKDLLSPDYCEGEGVKITQDITDDMLQSINEGACAVQEIAGTINDATGGLDHLFQQYQQHNDANDEKQEENSQLDLGKLKEYWSSSQNTTAPKTPPINKETEANKQLRQKNFAKTCSKITQFLS